MPSWELKRWAGRSGSQGGHAPAQVSGRKRTVKTGLRVLHARATGFGRPSLAELVMTRSRCGHCGAALAAYIWRHVSCCVAGWVTSTARHQGPWSQHPTLYRGPNALSLKLVSRETVSRSIKSRRNYGFSSAHVARASFRHEAPAFYGLAGRTLTPPWALALGFLTHLTPNCNHIQSPRAKGLGPCAFLATLSSLQLVCIHFHDAPAVEHLEHNAGSDAVFAAQRPDRADVALKGVTAAYLDAGADPHCVYWEGS